MFSAAVEKKWPVPILTVKKLDAAYTSERSEAPAEGNRLPPASAMAALVVVLWCALLRSR